jgi:hypothetical protein
MLNCTASSFFWLHGLRAEGATDLATLVESASRQASGMSTEFLGESRIAIRQVVETEKGILTEAERKDLFEVLQQLDDALDHRRRDYQSGTKGARLTNGIGIPSSSRRRLLIVLNVSRYGRSPRTPVTISPETIRSALQTQRRWPED